MRRSELLGLRWRDIDHHHRRLSTVRTIGCVGIEQLLRRVSNGCVSSSV